MKRMIATSSAIHSSVGPEQAERMVAEYRIQYSRNCRQLNFAKECEPGPLAGQWLPPVSLDIGRLALLSYLRNGQLLVQIVSRRLVRKVSGLFGKGFGLPICGRSICSTADWFLSKCLNWSVAGVSGSGLFLSAAMNDGSDAAGDPVNCM